MSTLKNLFKYIGIFLGICLAIVLVVLGAMVLFKFELFGYKYVKISAGDKNTIQITKNGGYENAPESYQEEIELVDRLTLNTGNIDVIIKPWTNGNIDTTGHFTIVPNIQASGFAKVNENGSALTLDVKLEKYLIEGSPVEHYELIVTANCPTGFVNYGSSTIIIKTPYLTENIYNRLISDDTGAYDKLNKASTFDALAGVYNPGTYNALTMERVNAMQFKQIKAESTTGSITITDALTGANNEISAKAKIYCDNLITKTTSGNLTLHRCGVTNINATSDTGDMKFEQLTNATIPGNVSLSNKRGKITFDDGINLGYIGIHSDAPNKANIELNGELNQVKLSSLINANLTYNGDADFIKIDSILDSTVQINSVNAHINVGSIYSNGYIHFSYNAENQENNTKGNRTIDIGYIECSDNFGLSTWNKPITIGTLVNTSTQEHSSTIVTDSGNITVNDLIGNTDFITQSGNITVKQRNTYKNDESEKEALALSIATQRHKLNLQAKQNQLAEFNKLVEEALKSNDKKYKEQLDVEIAGLESQITEIQNTITNEKNDLIHDNIDQKYNEYLRTRTNISTTTVNGTVKLSNLFTTKLNAQVKDNGKATMYIQFNEIDNADSQINITSGVGNTNLYLPTENTSYWVYAEQGTISHKNALFFANNDLSQGNVRASTPVAEYPLTNKTIKVVESSTGKEDEKTLDEIKALNYNFGFVTVKSSGGDTNLYTTADYAE